MNNGISMYSKGQMNNYFTKQVSKGKTPQNAIGNTAIISDIEGMKSPIRSVYQGIAKGSSSKAKFRTSKNSPERLFKYQERIKEIHDESMLRKKESIENQGIQIKNAFSNSKIHDNGGFDHLFLNKIQKIQSKTALESNNKSNYSNQINNLPNKIQLETSKQNDNIYSKSQKYCLVHKDNIIKKNNSTLEEDEINKEIRKNNSNISIGLNINTNMTSSRHQSANFTHFPYDINPYEENSNREIHFKELNMKDHHLIKSKSNPRMNPPQNFNSPNHQQMYVKYSNVLMENINKSPKSSAILLPIDSIQSKLNKNLSSEMISKTTCQTKNNSRKQSAEKNGKLVVQCPIMKSLDINNILLSTKAKSGIISTKGSASSLIKQKEDIINKSLKQSCYPNPFHMKGISDLPNSQILLNAPLNLNIHNELIKSPQFSCYSKNLMNINEIKYIDYVSSNIKNNSFKNPVLSNKTLKTKEEIEKDLVQTKLLSIQQNKSINTVQSKQNSKSTSRVEEYPNNLNSNNILVINNPNESNNLSNRLSPNYKINCINNSNQVSGTKKINSTGITIKKHSPLIVNPQSPKIKSSKEYIINQKDSIDAKKKDKQSIIPENKSEELKQDSNRSLNDSQNNDEIKHIETVNISVERIFNETNQSMQSTTRESVFYLREKEKVSNYIKQYYCSNSSYPESKFQFYKYGRLIGKGAFGKVNLALHIGSGRLVAIKSFNKSKLISKNAIPKIKHEISVLTKLQHPFISQILDTFETKKHIMIIMEYLCGDLLSFIRKRSKLSENSAKIIFKQLIEGLKFIHANNIVHRDIKLDNILIDLNNTVKICDFGVSRKLNSGDVMHEHCGTPAYIAPEIFKNNGYVGFTCDIWSAGVTLYYMLSGNQPFKGTNLSSLHSKVINGKFEKLKKLSQEANDLIEGMLQVNPKKRLTINQILTHPWLNGVNIKERSQINLFTNAEKILLKKFDVNYLNSNKDDMIEYFTNKNLDTIKEEERKKKGNTKSLILAPYNSDASYNSCILSEEIKLENSICKFNLKIKLSNIKYELNNNEEIDNGAIITKKNSSDNSNYSLSNNSAKPISPKPEYIDDINPISLCSSPVDKFKEISFESPQTLILKPHLIREIEKTLGYDYTYTFNSLKQKKVNYATATYYLLAQDYDDAIFNGFEI